MIEQLVTNLITIVTTDVKQLEGGEDEQHQIMTDILDESEREEVERGQCTCSPVSMGL